MPNNDDDVMLPHVTFLLKWLYNIWVRITATIMAVFAAALLSCYVYL